MTENNDKNVQLLKQQEGIIQELERRCDELEKACQAHLGSSPVATKRDGGDVQTAHLPGYTDVETHTSMRQAQVDAGEAQNEESQLSCTPGMTGDLNDWKSFPEDCNTDELCHDIPLQVRNDVQEVGGQECHLALPQRSMHLQGCVVHPEDLVLADHLHQVLLCIFATL